MIPSTIAEGVVEVGYLSRDPSRPLCGTQHAPEVRGSLATNHCHAAPALLTREYQSDDRRCSFDVDRTFLFVPLDKPFHISGPPAGEWGDLGHAARSRLRYRQWTLRGVRAHRAGGSRLWPDRSTLGSGGQEWSGGVGDQRPQSSRTSLLWTCLLESEANTLYACQRQDRSRSGQPSGLPSMDRRGGNCPRAAQPPGGVWSVEHWTGMDSDHIGGDQDRSSSDIYVSRRSTRRYSRARSRQDGKARRVIGPHHAEVATIKGCDSGNSKSFRRRDDRCVYRGQGQGPILGHELGDPQPVGGMNRLNRQDATREVTQESNLRVGA